MKRVSLLIILSSILLTGCATTDIQKQQALTNAPLVSAGLITPQMAKYLASDDANKIQQLIDTSQPQINQTWKNNITHNVYQFASLGIEVNAQGQPCRTYQIKALIGRHDQTLRAIACRQADGTWQATEDTSSKA